MLKNKRPVFVLGASVLAASLALSACGTRSDGSSGSTASGSAAKKVVKIGVILPLSGDLSAIGLGGQHSVELAVKQANEKNALPGWTIEALAKDDQGNPDVGKNAATQLTSDPLVAGVVGDYNSSVSQNTQPVFAAAHVTQVTPGSTGTLLTQGADYATAPKRPYDTFFRTCTNDAVQGPFAARYLFNKAGIKKVATIHDKKTYGQGLVLTFTAEFKKLGGEIVAAETINPDDANYQAVIAKVKPSAPQAVYYGGEYPQAGPLSQQMKAAGLNVPLMGGDGIFDPTYIKLAGKTATGDIVTGVGAPAEAMPEGKSFLADYEKAGYKDPAGAIGAYSYDAANAIIEALKVSLKDATSAADPAVRQATVDAMAKVSFDGITGKVGFDQYGDSTTRVLTAYKVVNGAWTPALTEEFK